MSLKSSSELPRSGARLWDKAKKIIPGGNQLLSKRSERFLPGLWPAYYRRAKGCEIWGMDGEHYYDFSGMGVGACILGYADEDVNTAVINAVENGSMCTLNCPEEIELAEKLISLHPWARMVRFARSGGEACTIAVRIARAASGKDKVAFCGYHGWHDWYISSNLATASNLDDQLLPGLSSKGIPKQLSGTALPFHYNRLDELEAIVNEHGKGLGVIIMEPVRDQMPEEGFLQGVRKLADRVGAVLIFDEVTSGFVMNVGGTHLTLKVEPDVVVFGKAIGNGYPITAIVGKRDVMDHAQDTFISSTFWTERIGFAAALATIEKMEKRDVHEQIIRHGNMISEGWKKLARKYDLKIHVSGLPPHTHISFDADESLEIQTLYTQEMLKRGYLVGASMRVTYAYTDKIVEDFIQNSEAAFQRIREALKSGKVREALLTEPASTGFKRLT